MGKAMRIGFCLCLIFPISLLGQEKQQQETSKSCRNFVRTFYSWYLANALGHKGVRAWDFALKQRPYDFGSDLFRQLKEDSDAQDKAGPDIAGLDADPFVGNDGAAERYIVERITIKDGRCWAEIHAVRDRKEIETPDVTPELVLKDGRWHFVNFYYPSPASPEASNTLSELETLRKLRKAARSGKDKKL